MKIVITGATGYVGRSLVPLLYKQCENLVLVGRNTNKLREFFPNNICCNLEELPAVAHGFDAVVHLAVMNNDAEGSEADFYKVNAELAYRTASTAELAKIKKFYNITSIHAIDERNQSHYATSKRAAVELLKSLEKIEVVNIYLPFVLGTKLNGKLNFLNILPFFLKKPLQACFLAVKPSVKVEALAAFVLQPKLAKGSYILSEGQKQNFAYRILKRSLDVLFAVSVIGLLWWLLLFIWGVIKCGSQGPGIFAQARVGRYGRTFTCYKFRTMRQGTVQAGTHEVSQAFVTPIGRFLRRTKLDELPQVWNILKNEISLIGPRPGLPVQKELFNARQAMGVFEVKPGISGLAQVNDIDMSDPDELARWDARYVALQSLSLDMGIILATVLGRGQGDQVAQL